MIWLHRHNKRRFAWAGLALALVGLLLLSFARPWLTVPAVAIARPFVFAGAEVSGFVVSTLHHIRTTQSLINENASLHKDLAAAELELSAHRDLADENEKLKAMLGRHRAQSTVLAAVLAKPPVSPYDTLLVDSGENQGIAEGDAVFAGPYLIGRIESVRATSATVRLLSAPGEETTVFVGPAHIETTAVGKGGGNFELRLPRDISLTQGEAVVLPGLAATPLGLIDTIAMRPTDTFQIARFRLPINFFELSLVEVAH